MPINNSRAMRDTHFGKRNPTCRLAMHGTPKMVWKRAWDLSRFRSVNQRIGLLRFAAAVDLDGGAWHGGEVCGCGER